MAAPVAMQLMPEGDEFNLTQCSIMKYSLIFSGSVLLYEHLLNILYKTFTFSRPVASTSTCLHQHLFHSQAIPKIRLKMLKMYEPIMLFFDPPHREYILYTPKKR